ncbi:hypothetical protein QVD17_28066 [Tagetes erecta]|uniref:NB-ARC n=1 Tax=Tagetes erecta TaxID=13708 RepID=A0AAD8KG31_TARER|nr:hypothetical protein QVD17_28066 [Tagetes erecta]
MAELVISALLPLVVEKLASATFKNIARYKGIEAEIKKWQRSLTQIQDVLADASRKEITNQSVKRWLNDLQHLAYDIDDILDAFATEAMDNHESSKPITNMLVRKIIPRCCTNFSTSNKMHEQLDIISAKLQDLVKERTDLGLRVEEETRPTNITNNRRFQSSVVDPSSIVGRQAEKEELAQQLLKPSDEKFSIVPIVGMGGVGKTTLAKLLYDEKQVKDHFELKAWVCVSDDFDSFRISKVVFQSVAGVNKEFADLNLLQVDLVNHLRGKRFIFVLDDVWSESYGDWETLVAPFHVCAPGSKIIITTRKEQLLQKLGYNHLNHLQSLSHDDALSLFALHALGVNTFDSHMLLKPHGEGIVKKCKGLPLALIALGTSLRTKEDEDSWKVVLESAIWRSKDDLIVPALRLSYYDLSAPLKQLFAYCSLFPKDFLFDKEELVLLWMAEGFLHQSTPCNSTEERLGQEYFDDLLSRTFFQHAPNKESLFVMHDLMNDLSTYVASEFSVRLDNEMGKHIREEMLEKYRHVSFVREKYATHKKLGALTRTKRLRTFLATSVGVVEGWGYYLSNKVLADLLPKLPLLRVLCLSNFQISKVPDTIGTLRHLRYLNLSQTAIIDIPENVCNLYNLQTLIVSCCHCLTKLPINFLKLKNLRHLDIRDTPLLHQVPLGIGELTSLQTFSKIIIEGENGFEIAKLKDLNNLCGRVSIAGLDKVKNTIDARVANFSQKKLSEFEIEFSDESNDSQNEKLAKEVLNELKPCDDKLIQLKIRSYGGLEFPNWVGNPSFLHLKHVSVSGCKKCTSLPSFGQLPSLKELYIKGLHKVKVVGLELFGSGCAFPSLEILGFKNMFGWEKWSTSPGVVFPSLKELLIIDCPNLIEVTLEALPSLKVLQIKDCNSGVLRRLIQVASAVIELTISSISGLNDMVWRGVLEYLGAVEELSIEYCNELSYLWETEVAASKILMKLRELKVTICDNLVSLGEKEEEGYCRSNLLTSLRILEVYQCKNMMHCNFPGDIETLTISFCTEIKTISLLTVGQKLKSVFIVGCNKLLDREWGGQNISRMLDNVSIVGWTNLKSIIELKYLVNLTTLRISNCQSLESFPYNEFSNLTLLKRLEIIKCPSIDASFPGAVWPPNLCSLKKVSHPQHLMSLQHLSFWDCPKMMDLPEMLLPSLLSLNILLNCAKQKERCSKGGCYWPLIVHIPRI